MLEVAASISQLIIAAGVIGGGVYFTYTKLFRVGSNQNKLQHLEEDVSVIKKDVVDVKNEMFVTREQLKQAIADNTEKLLRELHSVDKSVAKLQGAFENHLKNHP